MSEAIFIEGLTKSYAGKNVVNHLNLSVTSGTVWPPGMRLQLFRVIRAVCSCGRNGLEPFRNMLNILRGHTQSRRGGPV